MSREFQFRSRLERSDNKLWSAHVRVPDRIARKYTSVEDRRVVCTLNGTAKYQTAILPYTEGVWILRVNTALRKKLKLEFGDEVAVGLTPDESKYGLPMPEELEELLLQDKAGAKLFHALTPGKQRTMLFIVNGAKSEEKRISRALAILRHLKANKGKIDYRKLNEEIKRFKP